MPTMRLTCCIAGCVLPRSSNVNATPGTRTRSSQPLRIAGGWLHHVGYTNTMHVGPADELDVLGDHRIEGGRRRRRLPRLVRLVLGRRHRRGEAEGVEVERRDVVPALGEAALDGVGDGVVEAVGVRVGADDEDVHQARP